MDMEGVLAITFIFGGGTLFLLSVSPVGRALAERIRGRRRPTQDPELLADVDALRAEVVELPRTGGFRRTVAGTAAGAGKGRGGRVNRHKS